MEAAAVLKTDAILEILAGLAVVYWRPDYTPGQSKQLYSQYLEDLTEFSVLDIAEAVRAYRRGPEKFFPLPGQLRELITTPPAWWVGSKTTHLVQRHNDARTETQAVVGAIERKALVDKNRPPEPQRRGVAADYREGRVD